MDPGTVAAISTTAVALATEFLSEAGKGAIHEVGKEAYEAIKACFIAHHEAEKSLQTFEIAPDSPKLQEALTAQLERILVVDEGFANKLDGLARKHQSSHGGVSIHNVFHGTVGPATTIGEMHAPLYIGQPKSEQGT